MGDDLPCADPRLLVPLKRSRVYGTIRPRVAELRPTDSWQQEGLHLFVFALRPEDGASLPEPPVAVFTMHPGAKEPISAVLVTPGPGGADAEIRDLHQLDSGYTAPLPT